MASTRIIVILKSTAAGSTSNRQISRQPLYSRRNVERLTQGSPHEEANQFYRHHYDRAHCCLERLLVFRYDERVKSNRDAGFAAGR